MSGPAIAQVEDANDAVDISATWSVDVARPNDQAVLAVVLDVAEGYHIGNSAELILADDKAAVMPTEIVLSIRGMSSDRVASVGRVSFPSVTTQAMENGEKKLKSKEPETSQIDGQVIVYVPVKLAKEAKPGTIRFDLSVTLQACDEKVCFSPTTLKQKLSLRVVPSGTLGQGCPAPELFARWSDRRASRPSNKAAGTDYKSKEPPIGPPWVRDLQMAQALALSSGRPIFLYSTKTFCPHCVVVESEMLSSPALKPHYDKAVWLYVYRDFTGSPEDRNAERMGDRYSLSSWPQLWLIDPHDLSTVGETGRTVESFAEVVSRVNIESTDDLSALEALRESEAKVIAFDHDPTFESAIKLIQTDDVVAQLAAVRFMVGQDQLDEITGHAKRLLAIPNDGLRYEVLKAIAKTGKGDAAAKIAQLVENPQPSRNFNVLRSHAIKALAVCGDDSAVAVIAPHAQGTARNSTARVSVKAMLKLVDRYPECRAEVIVALANGFPPIEKGMERLVVSHAKMVHQHLNDLAGRNESFPETYDEISRAELIKAWSSLQKQSVQPEINGNDDRN